MRRGKQTPWRRPGLPGLRRRRGAALRRLGPGRLQTLPLPGSRETPETPPSPPPAGSSREQSGRRTPSPAPPCLPPSRRRGSDERRLQPRTAPAAALRSRPASSRARPTCSQLPASAAKAAPGDWPRCAETPERGGHAGGSSPPMRQLLKGHAKQRPWPQATNISFVWGWEAEGCLFYVFSLFFPLTREGLNWIAWSFKSVDCAGHKESI